MPSPSELDEQSHYDDLSMGFSATSELEEALDAKEEELQTAVADSMMASLVAVAARLEAPSRSSHQ